MLVCIYISHSPGIGSMTADRQINRLRFMLPYSMNLVTSRYDLCKKYIIFVQFQKKIGLFSSSNSMRLFCGSLVVSHEFINTRMYSIFDDLNGVPIERSYLLKGAFCFRIRTKIIVKNILRFCIYLYMRITPTEETIQILKEEHTGEGQKR